MQTHEMDSFEYEKYLINAKMVNWDIDVDVIKFRVLDPAQKYLPDSLSKVNQLKFLTADERKLLSQIQARTYANFLILIERCINSKVLKSSQDRALGEPAALEAMVQFGKEELKHQDLFRRVERMMASTLPDGYEMVGDARQAANELHARSAWAGLAWISHFEISTLAHAQQSLKPEENVSELFKDILRFHSLEEEQHTRLSHAEWDSLHSAMSEDEIEQGVSDLIELLLEFDRILAEQSAADARYFMANVGRDFTEEEAEQIESGINAAYHWQHLGCGLNTERSQKALAGKISGAQIDRILAAFSPGALQYVPAHNIRHLNRGPRQSHGLL